MNEVSVSILAFDFGKLAEEAKRIEEAGADAIHVDIMDGHFVKNLTMGPKAVAAINCATDLFLDVHLMMYNPFDYIERFIEAGADRISFHFEATEDIEDTLSFIRRCGKQAGLAFNPETSFAMVPKYLDLSDVLLFMGVQPGFGGQNFIEEVFEKISITRKILEEYGKEKLLQVDGGINLDVAKRCVASGANGLVSGTYLALSPNLSKEIAELKKI